MSNPLYIVIEAEGVNSVINLNGKGPDGKWEECFTLSQLNRKGIQVTDKSIFQFKDVLDFSTSVNALFTSIIERMEIRPESKNDNFQVKITALRMTTSEEQLLWQGDYKDCKNTSSGILSTIENNLYSYICEWKDFFLDNDKENKEKDNNQKVKIKKETNKGGFFFCYILPALIFALILLPTIWGTLIFAVMAFRGKEEFVKGYDNCADGIYKVDWDFTEYKYSSNGKIESGLKDLDLFLIIIQPILNLLLRTVVQVFDLISVLILKILFVIGCGIYGLVKRK